MGHCNVVCSDCGAEAHSKCPYCRSVFPDNQMEAMLSYQLKRTMSTDELGINWLDVSLYVGNGTEKDNMATAMERLLGILSAMQDPESHYPTIAQYCCDHRWTFKPGQKSTIGCGHGSKKRKS